MTVEIRPAQPADVDFLAWVMLQASRSHLERGIYEYVMAIDEPTTVRYLRAVAQTSAVHLFHWSLFTIAEVDGNPAAAMCAYDPATQGYPVFFGILAETASPLGIDVTSPAYARRSDVLNAGFPPYPSENQIVIENVATVPEHRGAGLVQALLHHHFESGAAAGHTAAQIGVFLGNDPARRAYLKAGYEVRDERRDPRWQEEIGAPGTELLWRPL